MASYHLIGIKGSGMSALAQILHDLGHHVQGSDVETTFFTQRPLEQRQIPIYPFRSENITKENCMVVSNAFGADHVEVATCQQNNLPCYRYHEFLGEFSNQFSSIAVTGAHGKTSTTGLLAHVCKHIQPTSYLIGDGTGHGAQDSRYFIFEACEYKRHFLAYKPDYAIITNIDFDHPDYYRDIEDVLDAFSTFSNQVKKQLIVCGDDPNVHRLKQKVNTPMLCYGLDDTNDLHATRLEAKEDGMYFDVYVKGEHIGQFMTPLHGKHNVLNTLAVIGICMEEDLSLADVKHHLTTFPGVKRRFTEKKWAGNVLIDDYAHHPAEIQATIDAVRTKYPNKKIISIFQPHTFTRTEMFLQEFADALAHADDVYLCDIFGSARENNGALSIDDLLNKIPASRFISSDTINQLHGYSDSILLFMGAGDIQKLQDALENSEVI